MSAGEACSPSYAPGGYEAQLSSSAVFAGGFRAPISQEKVCKHEVTNKLSTLLVYCSARGSGKSYTTQPTYGYECGVRNCKLKQHKQSGNAKVVNTRTPFVSACRKVTVCLF